MKGRFGSLQAMLSEGDNDEMVTTRRFWVRLRAQSKPTIVDRYKIG